jgi:hypothetical protein
MKEDKEKESKGGQSVYLMVLKLIRSKEERHK